MAKKILIIPDAHAHPKYDNERFSWLGRFALSEKPDKIICLGDFVEMDSLSWFDRVGDKEGKRYASDISVARDAMDRLLSPFRTRHAKMPSLTMLLGNHEARIGSFLSENPKMSGKVSYNDLPFEAWEVIKFKQIYVYAGIAF